MKKFLIFVEGEGDKKFFQDYYYHLFQEKAPELTIPAKKTKIYAYLETLLGKTKSQKKQIKDPYRNYRNPAHWNLDDKYLEPQKEFLIENLAG